MDSWTKAEIDNTYNRIQQQIDFSKIKNEEEFSEVIRRLPSTRVWTDEHNAFFWQYHFQKEVEAEAEGVEVPYPDVFRVPKGAKPVEKEELRVKPVISPVSFRRTNVKSYKNVKGYSRNIGTRWTKEEMEKAITFKKAGLNYEEISFRMGRSKQALSTKFSRLKRKTKKESE